MDWLSSVETDKVIHTMETDMVKSLLIFRVLLHIRCLNEVANLVVLAKLLTRLILGSANLVKFKLLIRMILGSANSVKLAKLLIQLILAFANSVKLVKLLIRFILGAANLVKLAKLLIRLSLRSC
ncbi:hypothetical protein Tco_0550571 [Tanacetum coccineum]